MNNAHQNKNQTLLQWRAILFWGALWGLSESVIGYIVHWLAISIPGLPGFIMFPFAFICMYRIYQTTLNTHSIWLIALIAAAIKLTDFLIPSNKPIYILNPATCILYEGIAVYSVTVFIEKKEKFLNFYNFMAMGMLWRFIFLLHLSVTLLWNLPAKLITDGLLSSLNFLILESFINSWIILFYFKFEHRLKHYERYSFITSLILVFIAVFFTLKL